MGRLGFKGYRCDRFDDVIKQKFIQRVLRITALGCKI